MIRLLWLNPWSCSDLCDPQVPTALSSKERREQWGLRSSLSPPPSVSRPSTPTPPSRTCSPLPLSRTSSPLPPPLPLLSTTPGPPQPSSIRESPGDEDTAALLPRGDALLHLSEDDGTENPLLTPLLTPLSPRRSPLPLSPVDLDLDESHVWEDRGREFVLGGAKAGNECLSTTAEMYPYQLHHGLLLSDWWHHKSIFIFQIIF